MSVELGTRFATLLGELESIIEAQAAWPSPETGFAALATRSVDVDTPADVMTALIQALASYDAVPESRWSEAPVLAAEGYALHLVTNAARLQRWADSATRLTARDPFPADRNSFFYRPLELLGIALGAKAVSHIDATVEAWLADILRKGAGVIDADPWHLIPAAIAGSVLSPPNRISSHIQLQPDTTPIDELALQLWLTEGFPGLATDLRLPERSTLEQALLLQSGTTAFSVPDVARAAVIYITLRGLIRRTLLSAVEESWQLDRNARDAVSLLVEICRRFPRFARELGARHGGRDPVLIKDEYDVQDLIRALLRLHFDDVRPEENTPSYAGSRTRMDFLVKREKIVVETKMTRANLKQREVVGELIQDKAHYAQHPGCKTLICFVYDPKRLLDNPDALVDEVSDETDALRTVVVVSS